MVKLALAFVLMASTALAQAPNPVPPPLHQQQGTIQGAFCQTLPDATVLFNFGVKDIGLAEEFLDNANNTCSMAALNLVTPEEVIVQTSAHGLLWTLLRVQNGDQTVYLVWVNKETEA